MGEIGELVSMFICPGLLGGRGGAVPVVDKPSLLCGRAPSFSDMRLVGIDLSSSESSPGLKGLSIRCGGGAPGRASHKLEKREAHPTIQTYAQRETDVQREQLGPWEVVPGLLLHLLEVVVALNALFSPVSTFLDQVLQV